MDHFSPLVPAWTDVIEDSSVTIVLAFLYSGLKLTTNANRFPPSICSLARIPAPGQEGTVEEATATVILLF